MENITTGHWIFAGIFMVVFIGVLIWSYRKDSPTHKKHYGNGAKMVLALIVIAFLAFIFKRLL